MLEIRIHGRGGQGNVVAAYLLAAAAFEGGLYGQAFPAFGAERRGAPVAAFVRCARRVIRQRCQVRTPDALIVQDPTLLAAPETLAGLAPDGVVLVNAGHAEALEPPPGIAPSRWIALPATAIAEKTVRRPIPNTALLGAFFALTGLVPLEALARALRARFPEATAARNRAAAEEASRRVKGGAWRRLVDARGL